MKNLMATIFILSTLSIFATNNAFIEVEINAVLVDEAQFTIVDSSTGTSHLNKVHIIHSTVSKSTPNFIPVSSKQFYLKVENSNKLLNDKNSQIIFSFNDQLELSEYTQTLKSSSGSDTLDTKLTITKDSIADNVLSFTITSALQIKEESVVDLYSGITTLNIIVQ